MRRSIAVMACLTVLMFSGASVALAKGPHHGGPGRGHGPQYQGQRQHGQWGNSNFRGPICGPPVCAPRPYVAAYPVYPAYPVAPVYPRLGFGLGGSNFSFWYQQ
jgi:hypothetical protein